MNKKDLEASTGSTYAGMTAIHMAAKENNLPVVKMLVDKGVDINIQMQYPCDEAPTAPLYLAVTHSRVGIVEFLWSCPSLKEDTNSFLCTLQLLIVTGQRENQF